MTTIKTEQKGNSVHEEMLPSPANQTVSNIGLQDALNLIQQLQFHQKELIKQNDELHEEFKEFQDSHKTFVRLFDRAPFGYLLIDHQGLIVEVNNTFAHMLGEKKEKLINREIVHFFDQDDRQGLSLHLEKAKTINELLSCKLTIKRPDSSTIAIWICSNSVKPADNDHIYIQSAITDISKLHQYEKKLFENENNARLFLKSPTDAFTLISTKGIIIDANSTLASRLNKNVEDIIGHCIWDLFLDKTGKQRREVFDKVVRSGKPLRFEDCRHDLWSESVLSPIFNDDGKVSLVAVISRDITERKQVEKLLNIQRDLGIALSATSDLSQALNHIIEATLKIEGIDCGGVYLIDPSNNEIYLVAHRGLSSGFIREKARFSSNSSQSQIIRQGKPVYKYREMFAQEYEACQKEGLQFIAVIPVTYKKEIVAVLNLASHTQRMISSKDRNALEAIAARIGSVIARIQAEEELRKSNDKLELKVKERTDALVSSNDRLKKKTTDLEEANIALKVLLKKRDDDKKEFEESVLSNVMQLITPHMEKLKNTRLDNRQQSLVEMIDSDLKSITSPFVRSLSYTLMKLTPAEINIANLIKQGKTSKEIANILIMSKKTIDIHRYNIRKKLGIKNKKINLQTHLLSYQ